MEIAIAIVTLILLCILTLNALYFFISMIISDWKANKAAKELSNLFNKLIEEKKTSLLQVQFQLCMEIKHGIYMEQVVIVIET